ncbi:hypothetical protein LY76DRAFT_322692 [Colletotrichum caudatum]|nr:hypothetical protein LY76DRAFT_322692 [Colletotrichum caudatum]
MKDRRMTRARVVVVTCVSRTIAVGPGIWRLGAARRPLSLQHRRVLLSSGLETDRMRTTAPHCYRNIIPRAWLGRVHPATREGLALASSLRHVRLILGSGIMPGVRGQGRMGHLVD